MTVSSKPHTHPMIKGKTSIWQRVLKHNTGPSLAYSTQENPGSQTQEQEGSKTI